MTLPMIQMTTFIASVEPVAALKEVDALSFSSWSTNLASFASYVKRKSDLTSMSSQPRSWQTSRSSS